MRILIWSDSYIPLVGGGELFTYETKRALDNGGYKTHLATVRNGVIQSAEDVTTIPILRVGGVPIASPPALHALLKRFQPEAILLIGPSVNNLTLALLSSRCIPIVVHYLADLSWRSPIGRLIHPAFFRWLLPASRKVLTISDRVQESLAAQGVPSEHIVCTRVGSDIPLMEPSPQRDDAVVFIGGLGRSHEYKRPDLLISALPHLKDRSITVTFIGKGETEWLVDLARSLKVEGRVKFVGAVSDRDKTSILRRARALVLPSPTAKEGFGIVALEAMRLGTPVVVGRQAGASELVDATGFGRTWSGAAAKDLAKAVDYVLEIEPRVLFESFQRFANISAEYTWERVAQRTVAAANCAFGLPT